MDEYHDDPITLGVSQCLLGDAVRYDGGHKHDRYITDTLGSHFTLLPICPEAGPGLEYHDRRSVWRGIPQHREPSGCVTTPLMSPTPLTASIAPVSVRSTESVDSSLKAAHPVAAWLGSRCINRQDTENGAGPVCHRPAAEQSPPPLEEEGRLNDAGIHNNFMERVFAYHRWQQLIASGLTTARLIDFHARHKLILMAHGNTHYSTLGRIIAAAGKGSINKREASTSRNSWMP